MSTPKDIPPGLLPPQLRQQPTTNGKPHKATAGPMLDRLRDVAGSQREKRRTELDAPGGWKGLLRIRYHGLPLQDLERYANLVTAGQAESISVVLDTIASCCEALLVPAEDGGWEELCDEQGPLRFEDRLARFLDPALDQPFELSPVEVIERLFIRDDNAAPLMAHNAELQEWLLEDKAGLEPGKSLTPPSSTSSGSGPPSASRPT